MSVILQRPWMRQPPAGSRINLAHPLMRGIQFAHAGSFGQPKRDLTGTVEITYNNVTRGVSTAGVGLESASTSAGYFTFPAWNTSPTEGSLLLFHRRNSTSNNGLMDLQWGNVDNHYPYDGAYYIGGFWYSRWLNGVAYPSGKAVTDPHILVVTVKDGAQRAYHDGVLWGANTLTGNMGLPPTITLLGSSFAKFGGELYLALMWSRFLEAPEVASLSRNPWQVFAPLPRRIWVPSAASGAAPTLTAASAINITATDATPRVTFTR